MKLAHGEIDSEVVVMGAQPADVDIAAADDGFEEIIVNPAEKEQPKALINPYTSKNSG